MQNKVLRGVIIIDPPYIYIYIWVILLLVTEYEYYSVTLFELTVSDGCTNVFEEVELMLSVVFNRSSSLVQKLFVIFLSERGVEYIVGNLLTTIFQVYWTFLQNHYGLRAVLKKSFFWKLKTWIVFWTQFQTVCRNWANKMARKLVKIHIFHICIVFSISIWFKSNLKNCEILGETYFCDFLQIVCRIDANDTALESYGKCTTFSYRNIFLIPYGLKMNSITV